MRSLFFRETSCSHRGSRTARGGRERSHLKEHYTRSERERGGGGGTFFRLIDETGKNLLGTRERACARSSVSKRIRLNSCPPSSPPSLPPFFSFSFFFLRPILDPAWVEIGLVERNRVAAVKLFRAV
jgi:hypothetical protein